MKPEDCIKIKCETCNRIIDNKRQYKKHFDRNHTIHVTGLVSFDASSLSASIGGVFQAVALEDAKAGESVKIRI